MSMECVCAKRLKKFDVIKTYCEASCIKCISSVVFAYISLSCGTDTYPRAQSRRVGLNLSRDSPIAVTRLTPDADEENRLVLLTRFTGTVKQSQGEKLGTRESVGIFSRTCQ